VSIDYLCEDFNNPKMCYSVTAGGTSPSAGPQECFNINTRGDNFGNCGHNIADYIACGSA